MRWLPRGLRPALFTPALVLLVLVARTASAQQPLIREVQVEQEGAPVADRLLTGLIETKVGEALSMRDVRETITHFMSLNRFDDVQVYRDELPGGVRVRYVLVPQHPIDRVEFRGVLGLADRIVRASVTDRFGALPAAGRIPDIQRQLVSFYREHGFNEAAVNAHVEPSHNPDRASLVVEVQAGRRAVIRTINLDYVAENERAALLMQADITMGEPYDADAIQRGLARYEDALHARGYYEARATHFVSFEADGTARVAVTLDRGPHVSIAFAGDPVPENERERLVPIRTESSLDEDLLEDSSRAIEDYFKARGYRDAAVTYTRSMTGDELTITFMVARGPRYVVSGVRVMGNMSMSLPEVLAAFAVKPDVPFLQEMVDAGLAAIRNAYRGRGFTRFGVKSTVSTVPSESEGDRPLEIVLDIMEGPRTRIGSVTFDGNMVLTESQMRAFMTAAPGRPFSEAEIATDRDRIDLEYRNRGYDTVVVELRVMLLEGDTRADLQFTIAEGPQVFVDQVIIVGNERTKTETIERELLLHAGEPLGYSAMLESQQRLGALGLFRRIQITSMPHRDEPRRDLLVQVQEAPPTTVGYGGGIEGTVRLRPTGENGQAEERFEVAPRGFIEIGRRNLFGKNRSVNFFGRASLKSRDTESDDGASTDQSAASSSYGFNEYRVYTTYREPKAFNLPADVLVTGILEQGIRSSFNFMTREVRAEAGLRVARQWSFASRYSFERTKLFDEHIAADDQPLIDRLFPQVRLSKVTTSVARETRDDVLYPTRGTSMLVEGVTASRAIGSEVGFVKTFLQGFAYLSLPSRRRMVLALGARVGAAHGFKRAVTRTDDDGNPVLDANGDPITDIVQDLPASERFFAGGDTTVRGFALDRLGNADTISASGFPTGGNSEVILNAELRVSVMRQRAELVGFVDAGNVFLRATDLDITDLRPAAGFGVRYRSPIGAIRVDLGFNLQRRELVAGQLERLSVLHISLGQAF